MLNVLISLARMEDVAGQQPNYIFVFLLTQLNWHSTTTTFQRHPNSFHSFFFLGPTFKTIVLQFRNQVRLALSSFTAGKIEVDLADSVVRYIPFFPGNTKLANSII